MKTQTPPLASPLLLMVDDQPEQEIFPRLASLLEGMGLKDGKSFYKRIIAKEKTIHRHPLLDVAWSVDGDGVLELIQEAPKALVFMDLFWENEPDGSGYGIRLAKSLLEDEHVRENSIFLLKSRIESASADAFRRESIKFLRIQRSLFGHSETTERKQFLGANLDPSNEAANYELSRIPPLLLSLMEEAFADLARTSYLSQSGFSACLKAFEERNYFNVFKQRPAFKRRYVRHLEVAYLDQKTFVNFADSPLALGPIQQVWVKQNRAFDVKKAFTSMGKESRALEIALLRYREVAAVEALLFVLAGVNAFDEIEILSGGLIDQKWNPSKFENMHVCDIKDIAEAVDEIDEIVRTSNGKDLPEDYIACRQKLSPGEVFKNGLSNAIQTLIELKGILRRYCSTVAYDLVAASVSRLEGSLIPKSGMMLLPAAMDILGNGSGDSVNKQPRLERFGKHEKIYSLFNWDRINHNLVLAARRFHELEKESLTEAVYSALRLDAMCVPALSGMARLSSESPSEFMSLMERMKERVLVGLPHPNYFADLFSSNNDAGELRDIAFYLQDPKDKPRRDRGFECSLIELTIGGLHLLKYHIESFCRILTWSVKGSVSEAPELPALLAELWQRRGWHELVYPNLPKEVINPLKGRWKRKNNLLDAIEKSANEAKNFSEQWRNLINPYEVEFRERTKRTGFSKLPQDWMRLYSLPLPLDIVDILRDTGAGAAGSSLHRLSVISLIHDSFRGDPYLFYERVHTLLKERGHDFSFKEPADGHNWENDEEFLQQAEQAMDLLKG